jgi:twinkle protein
MSDKPEALGAPLLHLRVNALWEAGLPPGEKTGWPSIDKLYTVAPGQLTIITGWPGSGKSEWLDALLVNLMHQGWYTSIFSPENRNRGSDRAYGRNAVFLDHAAR